MTSTDDGPSEPSIGATVVDAVGDPVGSVAATGIDPVRRTIDWLIVDRPGGRTTAVPTFVASVRSDGRVVIPFPRQLVLDAPGLSSEVLSPQLAGELYAHYGLA